MRLASRKPSATSVTDDPRRVNLFVWWRVVRVAHPDQREGCGCLANPHALRSERATQYRNLRRASRWHRLRREMNLPFAECALELRFEIVEQAQNFVLA